MRETCELSVRTFRMGTDKEAALKPLEEAAEAYASWQAVDGCERRDSPWCRLCAYPSVKQVDCQLYVDLADELADCVQACCNLAARYDIDLAAAMGRCEARNQERGRYGRA